MATIVLKMSTIWSKTFLLPRESSGDHQRISDHTRGQKTTHAVQIYETSQYLGDSRKRKTCHANAFDHQIRVLIHCRENIDGFFIWQGHELGMCEHHPDRIESNGKEMVCKEHRGRRNTGKKGNGTVDAFTPEFEILQASCFECG